MCLYKPDIFHLWLVDMSGHRFAAACILRSDLEVTESMNMIRYVCVCNVHGSCYERLK